MMALSMSRKKNADENHPEGREAQSRNPIENRMARNGLPELRFRFAWDCSRSSFSSSELPRNFLAQRLPIRAACNFGLKRFHHRAHLRFRGRTDFADGFADDGRQFSPARAPSADKR